MVICETCQKSFKVKSHNQRYCSYKCAQFARRKIKWPPAQELTQMIQNHSILKIGRIYGVSDYTVRRWTKFYGIKISKDKPIKKIITCKKCNNDFLRKGRTQQYCSRSCVNGDRKKLSIESSQ